MYRTICAQEDYTIQGHTWPTWKTTWPFQGDWKQTQNSFYHHPPQETRYFNWWNDRMLECTQESGRTFRWWTEGLFCVGYDNGMKYKLLYFVHHWFLHYKKSSWHSSTSICNALFVPKCLLMFYKCSTEWIWSNK